ncbi:MAG: hypothetical protein ACJ8EA_17135, partial [Xanthobacteraceae bacterium]
MSDRTSAMALGDGGQAPLPPVFLSKEQVTSLGGADDHGLAVPSSRSSFDQNSLLTGKLTGKLQNLWC